MKPAVVVMRWMAGRRKRGCRRYDSDTFRHYSSYVIGTIVPKCITVTPFKFCPLEHKEKIPLERGQRPLPRPRPQGARAFSHATLSRLAVAAASASAGLEFTDVNADVYRCIMH